MSDFLIRMAESSRQRSAQAMGLKPESELLREAEAVPAPPPLKLSNGGFDLIAEVKRRSPALGQLAADALPAADQAQQYANAGAAAISVLTEPEQFHGELADLVKVVQRIEDVPAMRKDFLATPYQIIEARHAGAGGVLLVVAMLSPDELRAMLELALELGMFALIEVFDVDELERCMPIVEDFAAFGTDGTARVLVGVNCRDLRSLEIEFSRFDVIAKRLPAAYPWVAESGILAPEHAAEVAGMGYRLALVGTALMKSAAPEQAAAAMIAAGRR